MLSDGGAHTRTCECMWVGKLASPHEGLAFTLYSAINLLDLSSPSLLAHHADTMDCNFLPKLNPKCLWVDTKNTKVFVGPASLLDSWNFSLKNFVFLVGWDI